MLHSENDKRVKRDSAELLKDISKRLSNTRGGKQKNGNMQGVSTQAEIILRNMKNALNKISSKTIEGRRQKDIIITAMVNGDEKILQQLLSREAIRGYKNRLQREIDKEKPYKERKDKLDLEFVYDWFHAELRLDTFSNDVKVYNPYTKKQEVHKVHEKIGTYAFMYTHDFLPSHEYKVWRQANPDKKKYHCRHSRRLNVSA